MKKRYCVSLVMLMLLIGSCAVRSFPRGLPEAHKVSSPASVEIKFVEMKFRKPPLIDLYFDVVLRNQSPEPRWFLLPRSMGPGQAGLSRKGGIDVLEVFAPKGKGRVIIGEFLGTGGFQALLLRSGSNVRLRRLRISYWGDLPANVQVETLIAKSLLIGGESASDWFGLDPASDFRADISEGVPDEARNVRTKRTPNNKEVPTQIEEDRHLQVLVAIKEKQVKVSLRLGSYQQVPLSLSDQSVLHSPALFWLP